MVSKGKGQPKGAGRQRVAPAAQVRRPPVGGRIGLSVCVVGVVLLGVTWNGSMAMELTAGRIPFLIAGVLTGVGLVIIGGAIMLIESLRHDAEGQTLDLARLEASLVVLRAQVAPDKRPALGASSTSAARASEVPGPASRPVVAARPPAGVEDETVQIRGVVAGGGDDTQDAETDTVPPEFPLPTGAGEPPISTTASGQAVPGRQADADILWRRPEEDPDLKAEPSDGNRGGHPGDQRRHDPAAPAAAPAPASDPTEQLGTTAAREQAATGAGSDQTQRLDGPGPAASEASAETGKRGPDTTERIELDATPAKAPVSADATARLDPAAHPGDATTPRPDMTGNGVASAGIPPDDRDAEE